MMLLPSRAVQSHPGTNAECRMQNGRAKPLKARYMRGTSQVRAMCLGGDWEVQARYMLGTCEVHAWYKPGRSHPGAREPGRRTERWLAAGLNGLILLGTRAGSDHIQSRLEAGAPRAGPLMLMPCSPAMNLTERAPLPALSPRGGERVTEGWEKGCSWEAAGVLCCASGTGTMPGQE
jgi:hypothetical protein